MDACYESLRRHAAGILPDVEPATPVLLRFVELARRYADLERMTLGAVPLSFPAHLLEGEPAGAGDPLAQGLFLARRERGRLKLETGSLDRLPTDIENDGVKVIEVPFPPELPLLGAFVFDQTIGPAILIDATRPFEERLYALLHEYGHFLADIDPWRTWVCRPGGAADSPEELRAHSFAVEMLVPAAEIETYLRAVGVNPGEPVSAGLIQQLRVYFQADVRAILGGLLAAGHIHRPEIAGLVRELGPGPEASAEEVARGGRTIRYLGLAVLARRRGRLSWQDLARLLETDEATVRQIDEMFSAGKEHAHGRRLD